MAGNDSQVSSDWHVNVNNITDTNIEMITMSNSCSLPMMDSFCPPIWDQSCNMDAMLREGIPMIVPPSLSLIPVDSAFIERAARFSCFNGGNLDEMVNPFNSLCTGPMHQRHEASIDDGLKQFKNKKKSQGLMQSQDEAKNGADGSDNNQCEEAEFSGREEVSNKGIVLNKRKRIEHSQNNEEKAKDSDEKQTYDPNPCKEDIIHVRARRGQATNSHSLAERARREKISERMKLLQDLVPGCSKVTGKAVMLDEIINYVQSLQQQVEFLSMKVAMVNPQMDFDMETFLAKDQILQAKAGFPSSPAFPPNMTLPFMENSSEMFHRPMNIQSNFVCGGFRQHNSQAQSVREDELRNIVHNGFNSKAEL